MFRTLQQNDPRYCCAIVSPKCSFAFVISPKEMDYLHGVSPRDILGVYVRNIPSLGGNNLPDQGNAKFIDVSQIIYKLWYRICAY